ncbi:hypothetical protein KFK09_001523 [Dendrobium nobile]|uniref:Transmembrane protein n=1 Tax=Dendrobium nobile TaxID=94219 RepID=A0A8T3C7N3_DENNO|nr:hypothetical protein KFK09_001523 [Dendrobium nobile]
MMMMSSRRSHTFYIIVVFIVAVIFVMSMQEAGASRLMKTTGIDQENQIDHNSDVQEKIEKVMTMWMRKLPSGPSNRGAGH